MRKTVQHITREILTIIDKYEEPCIPFLIKGVEYPLIQRAEKFHFIINFAKEMMEKWYSERWKEQWHIQRRLGNQFIKEFESIQFENTPLCYLSEESILTAKKCKFLLYSYVIKLRKIRNVLSWNV